MPIMALDETWKVPSAVIIFVKASGRRRGLPFLQFGRRRERTFSQCVYKVHVTNGAARYALSDKGHKGCPFSREPIIAAGAEVLFRGV